MSQVDIGYKLESATLAELNELYVKLNRLASITTPHSNIESVTVALANGETVYVARIKEALANVDAKIKSMEKGFDIVGPDSPLYKTLMEKDTSAIVDTRLGSSGALVDIDFDNKVVYMFDDNLYAVPFNQVTADAGITAAVKLPYSGEKGLIAEHVSTLIYHGGLLYQRTCHDEVYIYRHMSSGRLYANIKRQ